jgi:hypothetical protein
MKKMSNAELLARLDERMKAQGEKLEEIHSEVKKTNGRVSVLEKSESERKGGWKATAGIAAVVGSIVGWLISIFK